MSTRRGRLRRARRRGGRSPRSGFDRGVVSQLIARAPGGAGPAAGRTIDGGGSASSPFALGAELLSLLGLLQDGGPVLLVLDDAHWIDPPSAAALLFALRRLYADRVCALIATRPGGDWRGGPSWSRFLDDGERARRIRLGGLDEHEVRSLVGSLVSTPLSRAAAERLREHTDGHPLYIRALVDELAVQSLHSEHGPLPAPPLVRRDRARPASPRSPRRRGIWPRPRPSPGRAAGPTVPSPPPGWAARCSRLTRCWRPACSCGSPGGCRRRSSSSIRSRARPSTTISRRAAAVICISRWRG